jgi:hypothetical protein
MRRLSLLFVALVTVAAAPAVDPVESVSLALARGMAAEEAGNGRAMLDAALQLEALGARGEGAEADLAAHWRALARARGVRARIGPYRGRALGPAYRKGRLDAGTGLATEQVFLAGQKAAVALVPQPGRTLSIRVSAPDKSICQHESASVRVTCFWLPLFTTRVRIDVSNRSLAPASYYLVSN